MAAGILANDPTFVCSGGSGESVQFPRRLIAVVLESVLPPRSTFHDDDVLQFIRDVLRPSGRPVDVFAASFDYYAGVTMQPEAVGEVDVVLSRACSVGALHQQLAAVYAADAVIAVPAPLTTFADVSTGTATSTTWLASLSSVMEDRHVATLVNQGTTLPGATTSRFIPFPSLSDAWAGVKALPRRVGDSASSSFATLRVFSLARQYDAEEGWRSIIRVVRGALRLGDHIAFLNRGTARGEVRRLTAFPGGRRMTVACEGSTCVIGVRGAAESRLEFDVAVPVQSVGGYATAGVAAPLPVSSVIVQLDDKHRRNMIGGRCASLITVTGRTVATFLRGSTRGDTVTLVMHDTCGNLPFFEGRDRREEQSLCVLLLDATTSAGVMAPLVTVRRSGEFLQQAVREVLPAVNAALEVLPYPRAAQLPAYTVYRIMDDGGRWKELAASISADFCASVERSVTDRLGGSTTTFDATACLLELVSDVSSDPRCFQPTVSDPLERLMGSSHSPISCVSIVARLGTLEQLERLLTILHRLYRLGACSDDHQFPLPTTVGRLINPTLTGVGVEILRASGSTPKRLDRALSMLDSIYGSLADTRARFAMVFAAGLPLAAIQYAATLAHQVVWNLCNEIMGVTVAGAVGPWSIHSVLTIVFHSCWEWRAFALSNTESPVGKLDRAAVGRWHAARRHRWPATALQKSRLAYWLESVAEKRRRRQHQLIPTTGAAGHVSSTFDRMFCAIAVAEEMLTFV